MWILGAFKLSNVCHIFLHMQLKDICTHTYMYVTLFPSCNLFSLKILTLKVLVATIDAQWEGMGDVGSARYEPALLPPSPTIRVLSHSNQ